MLVILSQSLSRAAFWAAASLAATTLPANEKVPPPAKAAETIDEIVAVVNGDIITRRDVDEEVAPALATYAGKDPTEKQRLWEGSLYKLVLKKIEVQAAKKRDFEVQKQDVDDEVEKARLNAGSEDAFRNRLDQEGVTLDQFKEQVADDRLINSLLVSQLTDRGARKPNQRPSKNTDVRPEEVRSYYRQHLDDYRQKESARLSMIAVSVAKVGGADAARAILDEARRKLEAGEDFASLAKKYSVLSNKEQGGATDWFGRDGEWSKPVMDFAFSNPPGAASPVIESGNMLLFLRQDGYRPESVKDFSEVSPLILDHLHHEKVMFLYYDIEKQLIRDAYIDPPELKERLKRVASQRK